MGLAVTVVADAPLRRLPFLMALLHTIATSPMLKRHRWQVSRLKPLRHTYWPLISLYGAVR